MNTIAGNQPILSLSRFTRAFALLTLTLLFLAPRNIALARPGDDGAAVPVPAVRPIVRELVEYEVIDEHFLPAKLVACHIPPAELEAVTRRLARDHPDVLVPQRALELFRFGDDN